MDIKGGFDHVLKRQLFKQIIEVSIYRNLIVQANFFLTNQKIQIIIEGYENKKNKIKINIL